MDGRTVARSDGRTDGRMDGWASRRANEQTRIMIGHANALKRKALRVNPVLQPLMDAIQLPDAMHGTEEGGNDEAACEEWPEWPEWEDEERDLLPSTCAQTDTRLDDFPADDIDKALFDEFTPPTNPELTSLEHGDIAENEDPSLFVASPTEPLDEEMLEDFKQFEDGDVEEDGTVIEVVQVMCRCDECVQKRGPLVIESDGEEARNPAVPPAETPDTPASALPSNPSIEQIIASAPVPDPRKGMQRAEPKVACRQLRRQNCTSSFHPSDAPGDVQASKKLKTNATNPESLLPGTSPVRPCPKPAATVMKKPAAKGKAKAKASGPHPRAPAEEPSRDMKLEPPFTVTLRKPQLHIDGVQKGRRGEAYILQGPNGPPPRRRIQTLKNNLHCRRRTYYD